MVEVKNLQFAYPGVGADTLHGLSFGMDKGQVFGFLGPSGAGKSTTQKILIKLLRGYRGEISVLGKPLNAWSHDYYERVGVSFELPNHYLKLTALENLRYFAALYGGQTEDPAKLLAMVGLENDGNTQVGQFSKGMKNRLNVARSMVHKPELLFLDEPTSGLDPVNSKRIKDIVLEKKAAGTTVFLTTHSMQLADELCDQVAFIVDGQIKLIDSPRALKLQRGRRVVRVEYRENGQLGEREFAMDGLGENPDFLTLLRNNPVETIHTQETTLENIFIEVTGRSLA